MSKGPSNTSGLLIAETFLNKVADRWLSGNPGYPNQEVIIVTHLLPDRPSFLSAINKYAQISNVISIPYSTQINVSESIKDIYTISHPTLSELLSGTHLKKLLSGRSNNSVILLEIGGYGTSILRTTSGEALLGVIEGTEAGRRRYEQEPTLKVPVVCMSESPTKTAESAQIGSSCVFSAEHWLRGHNISNEVKSVAVLGYGKVGRSVAGSCLSRGYDVYVYDKDFDRRLLALAEGFKIPNRENALRSAQVVFAATGERSWTEEDATLMLNGAILFSCTSKDIEFEVDTFLDKYDSEAISGDGINLNINGKRLIFANRGRPINFRDKALVGPILTLLQAEMIASLGELSKGHLSSGIQPLSSVIREQITSLWSEYFLEPVTGHFKPEVFTDQMLI